MPSVSSSPFSVPLIGDESGSNWSDFVIWALLITVPLDAIFFAWKVKETVCPTFIESIFPVSVPLLFIKLVVLTNCNPAGKMSRTSTLVALLGPALLTLMV